jgi:ribosomal small subunit protein bTHX
VYLWAHRLEFAAVKKFLKGFTMGAGDLRTRKGKISNGSHGKTRPGRARKKNAPAPVAGKSKPR